MNQLLRLGVLVRSRDNKLREAIEGLAKAQTPSSKPAFLSLGAGPAAEGAVQDRKQRQSMFVSDKRDMRAENNFGMPRQRLYSEQVPSANQAERAIDKQVGYTKGKSQESLV